jgi:hypothetical protein
MRNRTKRIAPKVDAKHRTRILDALAPTEEVDAMHEAAGVDPDVGIGGRSHRMREERIKASIAATEARRAAVTDEGAPAHKPAKSAKKKAAKSRRKGSK